MVWGHTGEGARFDDTILLVSELAANAVRHGPVPEWEFEVAVTVLADGFCFIEVSDADPAGPELRSYGSWDEEHGPGLRLVDGLAEAWGVWHGGRYGKTVWALVGAAEGAAGP
jgi:hypothetical protein